MYHIKYSCYILFLSNIFCILSEEMHIRDGWKYKENIFSNPITTVMFFVVQLMYRSIDKASLWGTEKVV